MSQGSDDGHALAGAVSDGDLAVRENSVINNIYQRVIILLCNFIILFSRPSPLISRILSQRDLLGIVDQPLDLHLVSVGSTPTGPTGGEGRLQAHPGDVLKCTPNVRRSPR